MCLSKGLSGTSLCDKGVGATEPYRVCRGIQACLNLCDSKPEATLAKDFI